MKLKKTYFYSKLWHIAKKYPEIFKKQTQRRAAADLSRHKKLHGYQRPYFPKQCPKYIFIIPIVLVEKKIDMSHVMIISIIISPL